MNFPEEKIRIFMKKHDFKEFTLIVYRNLRSGNFEILLQLASLRILAIRNISIRGRITEKKCSDSRATLS